MYTRLVGRFALIFYFYCEHVLFLNIKNQRKKFADCNQKFRGFSWFLKIKFWLRQILKVCSSINLPWGHTRSHTKVWPDPFLRLDVYWIQTYRQTSFLSVYLYIWKWISFKYQLPYDCESKLRVFAVETGKEFGIFDLRLNEENGDIFLITVWFFKMNLHFILIFFLILNCNN